MISVRSLRPFGGDEEDRTPDPLLAKQVLSQLSYTPTRLCLVPLVSKLWICQASFSRFCITEPSKLNNELTNLADSEIRLFARISANL